MKIVFLLQVLLLFVPTIIFSQTRYSDIVSDTPLEVQDFESVVIGPDSTYDDFPKFWLQFREYVLNFDTLNLFERMEFPILVFGYSDDDPVYVVQKENILWFWNIFLFGDGNDNDNMEIVKSTLDVTKIPWYYQYDQNEHSVGYLDFIKYQEGWMLKRLYMDTRHLFKKAPCLPYEKDKKSILDPR